MPHSGHLWPTKRRSELHRFKVSIKRLNSSRLAVDEMAHHQANFQTAILDDIFQATMKGEYPNWIYRKTKALSRLSAAAFKRLY